MENIKKAIKCYECNKVFETPVFLPCSHSICKKHINEKKSGGKLICSKCGFDHEIPSNGFPVNDALCEIIEAQISSIDFGSVHKEATESCAKLSQNLKDMENLLNNPAAYTYEEISQLKNRVHLKSEQLKLTIDEETQKLLNKLDDYQNRCENSLAENLTWKIKYESIKEIYSSILSYWKDDLNSLKFDESKWRKITEACNQSIKELDKRLKNFKNDLLLDEFKRFSHYVAFFEHIYIDHLFNSNDKASFYSFEHSYSQVDSNDLTRGPYDPNCYSTPKTPRPLPNYAFDLLNTPICNHEFLQRIRLNAPPRYRLNLDLI